jgi:hypothetical protein
VQSKKPSDAKPPDGTVFFIDRSLGVEPIRTELISCGLVVEIHDDHFARDEEDRVWLKTVGERGWVVLTKDQRLRYRPLEISALRAELLTPSIEKYKELLERVSGSGRCRRRVLLRSQRSRSQRTGCEACGSSRAFHEK